MSVYQKIDVLTGLAMLKDFAYRIEMPWFPYVLSFVILLLLTFAVVSIKAYRATQVNLVKYLKYE